MPKLPSKVIGIVGSRRRNSKRDYDSVVKVFAKLYVRGDSIVSGGCEQGADRFAEIIAKELGVSLTIHYPRKENLDTELLKINPRAAYAQINFRRNTLIAVNCNCLIACCALDRTGGTEDTVFKCLKLNKLVLYA